MPERHFAVDPEQYPFTSHWFERNGSHMHYLDEGEGFPVVMCHGNPSWSFLYRKIIKAMAGKCRCIAVDLPGFGYSEHPAGFGYTPMEHAQWLETLLIEHLKLEKFILVGQDWGGPIGLRVATRHPERLAGLVISNTWAWRSEGIVFQVFSRLMGNRFMQGQIRKHNLFAKHLMWMIAGDEMRKQHILEAYTAPFPTPASREGTAVFPREILAAGPWLEELERDLKELRDTPVEFIFGGKDLISSKKIIARWLRHFPGARVQFAEKAGHFSQEDCPQCYVAALERLLASTA